VAVARTGAVAVTWLRANGRLELTNSVEVARRAPRVGRATARTPVRDAAFRRLDPAGNPPVEPWPADPRLG